MKKLDINLKQPTEEEYLKARNTYIADYTEYQSGYSSGGFFGGWVSGKDVKNPDIGLAEWNKMYPQGFSDWEARQGNKLTSYGQQLLIDKINEIINHINKHSRPKD